jgi:hypothetical protein
MDDVLMRFMTDLVGRVDGPMSFRMILQPMVAILLAVRDGRKDAQEGHPPYGWALLTQPDHRRYLLHDGWKGISRVFILAFVLDVVYQYIALRWFYPVEAFFMAFLLAVVPYALLRGLINRITPRKPGKGRNP